MLANSLTIVLMTEGFEFKSLASNLSAVLICIQVKILPQPQMQRGSISSNSPSNLHDWNIE